MLALKHSTETKPSNQNQLAGPKRLLLIMGFVFLVSGLFGSLFVTNGVAAEKTIRTEPDDSGIWANSPVFQVDLADLKRHVTFLASDTLEGRESGSEGGRAAAAYIVSELKKYGLKPHSEQAGYYQEFGSHFRNILAVLPGEETENAADHEYIVIGGHYDHVGFGSIQNSLGQIGQIHNGADDNASGIALLLELAQAIAAQESKPKRPILFAFWDAEERGLLGSKHWCVNPTINLQQVKYYFNYDMVGRLSEDEIEVYGVRTAHEMQKVVLQHNHHLSLKMVYNWDNRGDSDHYPFFKKQIPYLMLHTGKHKDYHRPSDDVEKVNYDGLQRITRLAGRLLWDQANCETSPRFRRASINETEANQQLILTRRLKPEPRLGVAAKRLPNTPNANLTNPSPPIKVQVRRVQPDSPAFLAGIQPGDLITKFGTYPLEAAAFQTLVLKAPKRTVITFTRPPSTVPQKVKLNLVGSPQLLGVRLHFDNAIPGTALLLQVKPGSPAHFANLQKNDRIWAIENRWPQNQSEFFELIKQIPAEQQSVGLVIERNGQLVKTQVFLWPADTVN